MCAWVYVCVFVAGMALHPEDNHGSKALREVSSVIIWSDFPKGSSIASLFFDLWGACLWAPKCLPNVPSPAHRLPWDLGRLQRLSHFGGAKCLVGNMVTSQGPLCLLSRPGLHRLWDPLSWEVLSWGTSAAPGHHAALGTQPKATTGAPATRGANEEEPGFISVSLGSNLGFLFLRI